MASPQVPDLTEPATPQDRLGPCSGSRREFRSGQERFPSELSGAWAGLSGLTDLRLVQIAPDSIVRFCFVWRAQNSYAASQREAEYGVCRIVAGSGRWHAHMVTPIGIVPIAFHLLPGNGNVYSILSSACVPLTALKFYFRRIAIGLVAARFARLIGHKPSRVELLVQLGFEAGRMVVVLGHRMFREWVQRRYTREDYAAEIQSKQSHGLPPRRTRGTPRLITQLVSSK